MGIESQRTEADAIADIMRRAVEPKVIVLNAEDKQPSAEVFVAPQGVTISSIKKLLDEYRTEPERRTGVALLGDLDSFIAHVKRFADEDSAIFADTDRGNPSLLAVLDYHRAGAEGAPRFGTHRSRYAFPISNEWTAWNGANKKWMGVEGFAAFLEEHLADVTDQATDSAKAFGKLFGCEFAGPSKLLELSRGLSIRTQAKVEKHVNLSTGEGQVTFAETHEGPAGSPLKVPGAFLLAIPVFRNGAPYVIPARLRYRVQSGSITWAYDLHRIEAVFDDAIAEAVKKAQTETGRPVFMGTPE